jgi:hypothetical protein
MNIEESIKSAYNRYASMFYRIRPTHLFVHPYDYNSILFSIKPVPQTNGEILINGALVVSCFNIEMGSPKFGYLA